MSWQFLMSGSRWTVVKNSLDFIHRSRMKVKVTLYVHICRLLHIYIYLHFFSYFTCEEQREGKNEKRKIQANKEGNLKESMNTLSISITTSYLILSVLFFVPSRHNGSSIVCRHLYNLFGFVSRRMDLPKAAYLSREGNFKLIKNKQLRQDFCTAICILLGNFAA